PRRLLAGVDGGVRHPRVDVPGERALAAVAVVAQLEAPDVAGRRVPDDELHDGVGEPAPVARSLGLLGHALKFFQHGIRSRRSLLAALDRHDDAVLQDDAGLLSVVDAGPRVGGHAAARVGRPAARADGQSDADARAVRAAVSPDFLLGRLGLSRVDPIRPSEGERDLLIREAHVDLARADLL